MSLKLDMNKSAEALRLSLQKLGITPPQMEGAFDLDVSGSFDDEHRDGQTQDLLTRLVPWGMVFDPDKKLDVFTFSSGERSAYHVGDITPDTCEGYVRRNIIDRVPGYNGGTDYSYVLEKNLAHFGKKRSIIFFVTDGANSDQSRTEQVLAESEARGDQVYFLFIGISNQGGAFPFLQKIGDRFSNTGLVVIRDLKGFVQKSDEEINAELIGDELVQWLKK